MQLALMQFEEPALEDYSNETETLQQILRDLRLLASIQGTIQREQTVCRAQVQNLTDTLGVGLDERYPVASFTAYPSTQNLNVVTESILHRAGDLVRQYAKKAYELLIKILRWIKTIILRLFGRNKDIKEEAKAVGVVDAVNAQAEEVLDQAKAPTAPESMPLESAPDFPARRKLFDVYQTYLEAAEHYRSVYDNLAAAMLKEDAFVGSLRALGLALPGLIGLLGSHANIFHDLQSSVGDEVAVRSKLKTIIKATPHADTLRFKVSQHVAELDGVDPNDLNAYSQAIDAYVRRLATEHPKEPMDAHVAAKVIADPKSGFADPFVLMGEYIKEDIDRVEAEIVKMSSNRVLDEVLGAHPALTAMYEEAIGGLTSAYYSIANLVDVVLKVSHKQASLVQAVYNVMAARYNYNLARGEASGDREVVAKLNAMQKDLRNQISAFNPKVFAAK